LLTVSRDVLVVLLVLGIAANIALIAAVAWLNHRATRQARGGPGGDPGAPVAADDTDPARLLAIGTGLVDRDWVDTRPQAGSRDASPPETRQPPAQEGPSERGEARKRSTGRQRRFVLPDRAESHARTERAIAAFLGEPVAPDPESRTGRRRHRARRPAGAPAPRTDLVLSLAGPTPDPRIVHALSAAMRGAVRTSDQVVELPGGRLRVTLEADATGGEAFVRRARGVVRPWLSALDPDLELRVERPRTPSRQGAASS
jgi:hypothetical protein